MDDLELTQDEIEAHGVPIERLKPGDWFAVRLADGSGTNERVYTGKLVYPGIGSALVQIDQYHNKDNRLRWGLDAKVLPLGRNDRNEDLPTQVGIAIATPNPNQTKTKENTKMTTATAAVGTDATLATVIQKRYDFWTKQAATAEDKGDVAKYEDAIGKLEGVIAEAEAAGVELVEAEGPDPSDPAPAQPAPKTMGKVALVAKKAGAAGTVAVPKSVAEKESVAAKAARLKEAKAAKPIPGATRTVKEKKPAKLRACLDGCGTMVAGNFKMGHDAKLKSLILKVERGEALQSDIPEIAQDLLTFKKGDVVTEKNKEGKVTSKVQTFIVTKAPVKFQGRPEIALTTRAD